MGVFTNAPGYKTRETDGEIGGSSATQRPHFATVLTRQGQELPMEFDMRSVNVIGDLLATAERVEEHAPHHLEKVGRYTQIISRKMGHPPHDADLRRVAAELHDIGKIAISDRILDAPGKLSPADFLVMETHARIGASMIHEQGDKTYDSASEWFFREAEDIARHHHERWDGNGYPDGKKGEDIPLSARIVAGADVWDALRSNRSYKKAWGVDQVIEEMMRGRNRGHFDPEVIDIMMSALDEILQVEQEIFDKTSNCETLHDMYLD